MFFIAFGRPKRLKVPKRVLTPEKVVRIMRLRGAQANRIYPAFERQREAVVLMKKIRGVEKEIAEMNAKMECMKKHSKTQLNRYNAKVRRHLRLQIRYFRRLMKFAEGKGVYPSFFNYLERIIRQSERQMEEWA